MRKSVHMHLNYGLFAAILCDLASTIAAMPVTDVTHHETLSEAAKTLYQALAGKTGS